MLVATCDTVGDNNHPTLTSSRTRISSMLSWFSLLLLLRPQRGGPCTFSLCWALHNYSRSLLSDIVRYPDQPLGYQSTDSLVVNHGILRCLTKVPTDTSVGFEPQAGMNCADVNGYRWSSLSRVCSESWITRVTNNDSQVRWNISLSDLIRTYFSVGNFIRYRKISRLTARLPVGW